ncbi:DUF3560 domain-containing protein [Sphaerisporangium sp. NPDC051017]|uniref:DUF3560 domain-containing protein n=1 Tax=Sphaerisporangium sp. NPDC051017 TaxID=3154636 RepID=UPI003433258D
MIVISHTLQTGTVVYGTTPGDGSGEIIHDAGFRPSRYLDDHPDHGEAYWYVASTRRRPAKQHYIDRCAAALREAGHEVKVEVDNVTLPTTSFAELEAERYDRAEERTERFSGYADHALTKGDAMIDQVRQERSRIPLGQPHLIGHHSYNRTVRQEDRRNAKEDRGREHVQRGERWAGRAKAAAAYQAGREDLGTTQRRVERLEADVRRHQRYLRGDTQRWEITVTTDWTDDYGRSLEERLAVRPEGSRVLSSNETGNTAEVLIAVGPAARAITESQITLLAEEITYWKAHIAKLQEQEGRRVWSSADFSRGDFVKCGRRWYEIVRVNSKSLTVANGVNSVHLDVVTMANSRNALGGAGWTDRLPYDQAGGQMTAAEARFRYPEAFSTSAPGSDEAGNGQQAGDPA